MCWFCGQPAASWSACEVFLRKRVSSYLESLAVTRWSVRQIDVPRCESCAQKHHACTLLTWAAVLVGLLALVVGFALSAPARAPIWPLLLGIFIAVGLPLLVFWVLLPRFVRHGTRRKGFASEYPPVKAHRADGWSVGKPRGTPVN